MGNGTVSCRVLVIARRQRPSATGAGGTRPRAVRNDPPVSRRQWPDGTTADRPAVGALGPLGQPLLYLSVAFKRRQQESTPGWKPCAPTANGRVGSGSSWSACVRQPTTASMLPRRSMPLQAANAAASSPTLVPPSPPFTCTTTCRPIRSLPFQTPAKCKLLGLTAPPTRKAMALLGQIGVLGEIWPLRGEWAEKRLAGQTQHVAFPDAARTAEQHRCRRGIVLRECPEATEVPGVERGAALYLDGEQAALSTASVRRRQVAHRRDRR